MTPSPAATDAAERFQRRFGLDQLRFANSGTEATMYALRTARAFTDRKAIIKIEGGYHGGYDALQVSVKPDVAEAGPEAAPTAGDAVRRRGRHGLRRPLQRPRRGSSRSSTQHGSEVACVFMEPVLENIGIVVPDAGYLAAVRELCDRHGVAADLRRGEDRPDRRRGRRLAAPRA